MTEVTPNLPHFGSFCKYCFMGTLLRKGHLLPLAKGGKKIQSVADVDFADLRLLAYAPDGASYEYYTDDGETKDYDKPEHFVHITLDADGNAKSDRATVKVEG